MPCLDSRTINPVDVSGWGVSPRGAGFIFGGDVTNNFLALNKAKMVCRAHQLVMEGYKWHFNEAVLTVWSAPNYCYRYVTHPVCCVSCDRSQYAMVL
jgi:serine/threonine-protein phosphatase 4 catalytic subunit